MLESSFCYGGMTLVKYSQWNDEFYNWYQNKSVWNICFTFLHREENDFSTDLNCKFISSVTWLYTFNIKTCNFIFKNLTISLTSNTFFKCIEVRVIPGKKSAFVFILTTVNSRQPFVTRHRFSTEITLRGISIVLLDWKH